MPPLILSMRREDIPAVQALITSLHDLHHRAHPKDYRAGATMPAQDLAQALTDEKQTALVALVHAQVVGFCLIFWRSRPQSDMLPARKVAYVDIFCVDDAHHRQGIGRALYAAVQREAENRGMHSIQLSVRAFNTNALKFYEALGMEKSRYLMEMPLVDKATSPS